MDVLFGMLWSVICSNFFYVADYRQADSARIKDTDELYNYYKSQEEPRFEQRHMTRASVGGVGSGD